MALPPYLFVDDHTTINGRIENTLDETILMNRFNPASIGTISTIDFFPKSPCCPSKPDNPINNAAARIAGIISINTSESDFITLWIGFCF